MSTESAQNVAASGGEPSGYHSSGAISNESDQKLNVGFATMPREEVRRIARMGGQERGRQLHEAAMRGESGTARKYD